jgi:hypothetical protein
MMLACLFNKLDGCSSFVTARIKSKPPNGQKIRKMENQVQNLVNEFENECKEPNMVKVN